MRLDEFQVRGGERGAVAWLVLFGSLQWVGGWLSSCMSMHLRRAWWCAVVAALASRERTHHISA
eukprot:2237367-Prymnesium_polylepis.1